jgi:hypothetical protein
MEKLQTIDQLRLHLTPIDIGAIAQRYRERADLGSRGKHTRHVLAD